MNNLKQSDQNIESDTHLDIKRNSLLTKHSNSNTKLSNEKIQFEKDFLDHIEVERMTTIKSLQSDLDHDN